MFVNTLEWQPVMVLNSTTITIIDSNEIKNGNIVPKSQKKLYSICLLTDLKYPTVSAFKTK